MPESARGGLRAIPVRKLIGLLGAVVAVVTAVCPPIGYAINGYWKQQAWLAYRSEMTAARATRFIREHPADWQSDTERLAMAIGIGSQSPRAAQPALARASDGSVVAGQGREAARAHHGPRGPDRRRRLDRRVRGDHRHPASIADRNGAPGPRHASRSASPPISPSRSCRCGRSIARWASSRRPMPGSSSRTSCSTRP